MNVGSFYIVILEASKDLLLTIKKGVMDMSTPRSKIAIGMSSTFGDLNFVLGRRHLQLIEILDNLMKVSSDRVDKLIESLDFYHKIPLILFNYPWHNILHNLVYGQLHMIIDKKDFPLLEKQLFSNPEHLLAPLVTYFRQGRVKIQTKTDKAYTRGYMAHAKQLTRAILQSPKKVITDALENCKLILT